VTARRTGIWVLLAQAVSRLTSVYVFAVVAHRTTADQLGALALATSLAGGSLAVAPAIVGKPLAASDKLATRLDRAPLAYSAAVLGSVVASLALAPVAVLTHGLVRISVVGGVLGIPAVMVVESYYWREAFVSGAKKAALSLSAAYVSQAVLVTVAAVWLPAHIIVLAPLGALIPPALVLVALTRDITFAGAKRWFTEFRGSWLPYVAGVAASVALTQAIPVVLSATAGFASASTYRAGELSFGPTNLLIGVSYQTLLTQRVEQPRRMYARVSFLLALVGGLNSLVILLAPRNLIQALVGPTAPLLLDVLGLVTVQRVALAASSIGAVLLVALVSARRHGLLDILAASVQLTLLVTGGLVGGLEGSLAALAMGEVSLAIVYARMLRIAT
jgi:hypothetical protein